MYRTKLGLSESELMNKSWISILMETNDFPWYDAKGNKVIKGEKANEILAKYIKP
jgi:hypothetical protein